MKPRVIALVGSPQSGKTELRSVFESLGCKFVNLNEVGYEMRRLGSPDRPRYDVLVPGCLHNDGKHKPAYYIMMTQDSGLIERILEMECPRILAAAQGYITDHDCQQILILNWEYWFLHLQNDMEINHVLLLDCTDQQVWFERLRNRARSRGYDGPEISDESLCQMIGAVRCMPEDIRAAITSTLSSEQHTIIDTSADDWGETELRAVFSHFG